MKIIIALFFAVFLFTVSGSQYQMQPPPTSTVKVAVPLFINKTFTENLDEVLTGEVVDQFMLRGGLQLTSEEEAELLLKGKILKYIEGSPAELAAAPSERRVTIEVKVALVWLKKDKAVWEEKLREAAVYSALKAGSIQTREEAIKEISRRIGEKLVNLTLNWRS